MNNSELSKISIEMKNGRLGLGDFLRGIYAMASTEALKECRQKMLEVAPVDFPLSLVPLVDAELESRLQ